MILSRAQNNALPTIWIFKNC